MSESPHIRSQFFRETGLVINTVVGPVPTEEYLVTIRSTFADFAPRLAVWDFSHAIVSVVSSRGMRDIAGVAKSQPNSRHLTRVALILPADLSFGLGRMFEVFSLGIQVPWRLRAFRKMPDGFKWIGEQDPRSNEAAPISTV